MPDKSELTEDDFHDLALRVFELARSRKARSTWLDLRDVAIQLFGSAEHEILVLSACCMRQDLFAIHNERRIKLRELRMYDPSFDPTFLPVRDDDPNDPAEFWVYVTEWDVGPQGAGPYRAAVHRFTCRYVENRLHKKPGVGVKNYWIPPNRGLGNAVEAARGATVQCAFSLSCSSHAFPTDLRWQSVSSRRVSCYRAKIS